MLFGSLGFVRAIEPTPGHHSPERTLKVALSPGANLGQTTEFSFNTVTPDAIISSVAVLAHYFNYRQQQQQAALWYAELDPRHLTCKMMNPLERTLQNPGASTP